MNESGLPDIDIARWATCEREALHGPDSGRWGRVHVGALVAQAVRRELTGEVGMGNGELDLPCQTDEKTPRVADVPRQAALLAQEVRRLAADAGYILEPADDVPTGFWALSRAEPRVALASVRTGSHTDTAWLTLGQQLATLPDQGQEAEPVTGAVVIHVPRVRLDKPITGTLTSRDAGALVREWSAWRARVHSVLTGASALPRPGRQCVRCRLECGVRP